MSRNLNAEMKKVCVFALTATDSASVEALYGIKDSEAQYAMLKNDVQPTLLQLICFSNTPKKEIR